jgi:iron complex transport system ATP-binding protein
MNQIQENSWVLQVNRVSFGYVGNRVLERVSLELSKGETLGLLGENGSGKTTLLRLMAGLLTPEEGTINLFGKEIETYKRMEIARKISIVGQGIESVFDFTVEEVVLMGRNPYIPLLGEESEKDREKARDAMEKMGILENKGQPVTQLSAGEIQRVFIARSLAQDTPLLLLDEPTASLDIRHQIELAELLRELRDELMRTIVIVSHDINLITHVANRVVLIGNGTFLACGPVEEIIDPERLYETYGVRMAVEEEGGNIVVKVPWDEVGEGRS